MSALTTFSFLNEEYATSFKLMFADDLVEVNKVILPVIRRVMPNIIATDIFGVSPMVGPRDSIATLRIRYADAQAALAAQTNAVKKSMMETNLENTGNELTALQLKEKKK